MQEIKLPDNPWPVGTQTYSLYEHLRAVGEITTRDLHKRGFETARIRSDIRPYLRRHGLDYRCLFLERGNRLYQVKEAPLKAVIKFLIRIFCPAYSLHKRPVRK